ncbi:hypothetical protein SIPHO017v1_p0004 [Vibrio phage 19E33.1]|nr:hypothetical protein SIPHO017v1_p0004 [Vibrio phage 19E33.1]
MNAQQFLNQNKQINATKLANLLEVSSGKVTKMKKEVSKMQGLALDALHAEQAKANLVSLDITEYWDKTYGNTYFSGYVYFNGETYFLPFQQGCGSHCEDVALTMLSEIGVIPKNVRQYGLYTEYNIKVSVSKCETKKRDMYDGTERTHSEVK